MPSCYILYLKEKKLIYLNKIFATLFHDPFSPYVTRCLMGV